MFTDSQAPVPLRPDFAAFLLPLAALIAITIIALAYEIRSRRGRGVAVTMRFTVKLNTENKVHWVRDVTLREDSSRVRTGPRR